MPTGYTEKIVKGEMKTFKEFAILCSRAFGATMHMRDEPLSKPYVPREVVKISFEENKCEVFTKMKTGIYHSLDFGVCPQVKIGDKVKMTMEIMK